MADDKQRAIAVEVYARVAHDNDKRNGNADESQRLERELGKGKVKECDDWARAHGKPDDTPGRGPRKGGQP
jgi:hypothetical protein